MAFWPHMTAHRYKDIIKTFGSVDNFWLAKKSELTILHWRPEVIEKYFVWRNTNNPEKCALDLERFHARIITIADPNFPPILATIFDPPYALFVQGELKTNQPLLSVVGARKNTAVGERAIREVVQPIANEIGIVSGLAYGIDSLAHQASLNAQGYTIAVLGTGIDCWNNPLLAKKIIAQGGAIITEYPPGTPGSQFTFPKRNRIISGLSRATLIIEAGKKSGALITASSALEQGREVLAIPHSIFSPVGIGPNNLIKEGATVISTAEDLRTIFKLKPTGQPSDKILTSLTLTEQSVKSFLINESQTSDAITRHLGLVAHQTSALLTEMEIKGIIKSLPGNRYLCQYV